MSHIARMAGREREREIVDLAQIFFCKILNGNAIFDFGDWGRIS